jgi:signal transduction histidine kinase
VGGGIINTLVRDLPPEEQAGLKPYGVQSVLVVPLSIHGEFWGFMGVDDYRRERQWTSDEVSIIRMMSASIGAALERQQAEDKLRYERGVADTLREIGTVITSTLDLDEVMGLLLEQFKRVLPYDGANVMLIHDGVASIVRHTGYDAFGQDDEDLRRVRFTVAEAPLMREIVRTKKTLVCHDTDRDPRWLKLAGFDWNKSWLGAPIVVRGEVVGLYSLDSATPGFYRPEHIELVTLFAQQAAVAFENARLYQQIEAKTRELSASYHQLQALYSAGQSLLSTLDLEVLLNRFAEKITHLTNSTSAILCGYDPVSGGGMVQASYADPDAADPIGWPKPGDHVYLNQSLLEQATATQHGMALSLDELPAAFVEHVPTRLYSMLVVPMVNQGVMTGFVLIGESRPNQPHRESEMRLAEALTTQAALALERARLFKDIQELEHAKSEMIRTASHDLRAPLNRLQGYIVKLEELLDVALGPEHREYFDIVQDATRQMSHLITDILSLERIEAQHREAAPVIWRDLVTQVVGGCATDIEEKRHRLIVDCPPDTPSIRGDPAHLKQAIANLLSNAIKYTPDGGTITLRVSERLYGGKQVVAVEVQDTGIGLNREQQSKLFKPFYRARQPGTEHIPGEGMGLSVVKGAFERHQGRVYFDSEPGEGSLFGFWVPI